MKRIVKRLVIPVLVLVGAIVFLGVLGLALQPLVPSREYSVSATVDGLPVEARLLRPLVFPKVFYVKLAQPALDRYLWFAVSPGSESVYRPLAVYESPLGFFYIHTDQAHGLRLSDPKIEDAWIVSYAEGGAQFSNGRLAVKLSPQ